jgi:hypothetical protein
MSTDPFNDLEKLRVQPGQIKPAPAKGTVDKLWERRKQRFIKISWPLHEQLLETRGATYKIATEILRRHWRDGGKPIRLGTVKGVTRMQKRRALEELEEIGLISVKRSSGRAPRITVLQDKL